MNLTWNQIDFSNPNTEYLEVFGPNYPSDLIQRCTGSQDVNCGVFVDCARCTYSINSNVTITCGTLPSSDNTTISSTFDLSGVTATDSNSYTIPVQSTVDNNLDTLFEVDFHFENGQCLHPMLSFEFEEIDFAQSSIEFIDVYSPSYSSGDYIKQCTGTSDRNCGQTVECLHFHYLEMNTTDSVTVYLLKSAGINQFCEWSINANVTVHCGALPPSIEPTEEPTTEPTQSPLDLQFMFEETFDISNIGTGLSKFTQNVHSTVDNGVDVLFNVTYKFVGGTCYNPMVSMVFEEIDHASDDEYLEVCTLSCLFTLIYISAS